MKFLIQAHPTLTKTLKQKIKKGFYLAHLPKHKVKVFFIAISKTLRARMITFCIQAHPTLTKGCLTNKKKFISGTCPKQGGEAGVWAGCRSRFFT